MNKRQKDCPWKQRTHYGLDNGSLGTNHHVLKYTSKRFVRQWVVLFTNGRKLVHGVLRTTCCRYSTGHMWTSIIKTVCGRYFRKHHEMASWHSYKSSWCHREYQLHIWWGKRKKKLSFLNTLVVRKGVGTVKLLVYLKSAHTDRYLQFDSHHPLQHKFSRIRTLLDRCLRWLWRKRTGKKRCCI